MSYWHMVGCDKLIAVEVLAGPPMERQCEAEAGAYDAFPGWDGSVCPMDDADMGTDRDGRAPSGWAMLDNGEVRCPAHYDEAEARRVRAAVEGA
jgi:hypothetical protein